MKAKMISLVMVMMAEMAAEMTAEMWAKMLAEMVSKHGKYGRSFYALNLLCRANL